MDFYELVTESSKIEFTVFSGLVCKLCFVGFWFQPSDLEKAQLGLGHSYSRAKVKFNVNRVDNMVIQAIFLLDTLDKDVNSFSMRVRLVPYLLLSFNFLMLCF
jgi:RNA processing factor Prp31